MMLLPSISAEPSENVSDPSDGEHTIPNLKALKKPCESSFTRLFMYARQDSNL